MKPLVRRRQADLDIEEAIDWYLGEAPHMAADFIDALEQAYRHLQRHPAMGSPRYAHSLDLPGLRCWPCGKFPHMVFYIEQPDRIAVIRVLHGARDIPASLQPL